MHIGAVQVFAGICRSEYRQISITKTIDIYRALRYK